MKPTIIVADDDSDDQVLIGEALQEVGFQGLVHFVGDGMELIEYLQENCLNPTLVLLDLNMPRMHGRVALEKIKAHPRLRSIPVVVHSTSSNEEDIRFCYDRGVNTYVVKAMSYDRLKENLKDVVTYWFKIACLPLCSTSPDSEGSSNNADPIKAVFACALD